MSKCSQKYLFENSTGKGSINYYIMNANHNLSLFIYCGNVVFNISLQCPKLLN